MQGNLKPDRLSRSTAANYIFAWHVIISTRYKCHNRGAGPRYSTLGHQGVQEEGRQHSRYNTRRCWLVLVGSKLVHISLDEE